MRKYQHEYAVKNKTSTNGLAQHVVKTEHLIDWESTFFLDSDSYWTRRKIKEALFIDCLNPQKQISDAIMNLEKGLEISDCWKEFNADIMIRNINVVHVFLRFQSCHCINHVFA